MVDRHQGRDESQATFSTDPTGLAPAWTPQVADLPDDADHGEAAMMLRFRVA